MRVSLAIAGIVLAILGIVGVLPFNPLVVFGMLLMVNVAILG